MRIKPEDLKNYIGKKIRCDCGFDEGTYIVLLAVGDDQLFAKTISGRETTWSINQGVWETYEEPKKKVKMWLWICRNNGEYALTYRFYSDIESASKDYSGVVLKAPWSEIEVDE